MKNFFFLLMLTLSASSCIGSLFERVSENVDVEGVPLGHEMIVLGDKLEDPYSLDNMTRAFNELYPTKADRLPLEHTHLYVRFLPDDEHQFERLEQRGLVLIDHPVDYKILREGDYYHDPEIEEGKISWQYSVVSRDFDFPQGIRYEILDQCYIPEDELFSKSDGIDWAAIERLSFQLTGNEDMLLPQTKAGGGNTPSGRITIEDNDRGKAVEGVKGVRVSCNTFVRFAHCYTDEEGNYQFDKSFSANPRYRIVFKNRYGFGIGFNLILCPASYSSLGKHSPSGLDLHITAESDRVLYCRSIVNNAGYDYYKQCKEADDPIRQPPSNLRIWLFQGLECSSAIMMQQGVLIDGSIIGRFLGAYSFLVKMFLPDITLGLRGADSFSEIYDTAIHEFAHASHFMLVGKDYWNTYAEFIIKSFISSGFVTYGTGTEENYGHCEVGEMWAYYVQTKLHNERYKDNQLIFGTNYWFYPQIFFYLDERGLGRHKIFAALGPDIKDREILKKKLISLYPQFKTTINQAFNRYR